MKRKAELGQWVRVKGNDFCGKIIRVNKSDGKYWTGPLYFISKNDYVDDDYEVRFSYEFDLITKDEAMVYEL